MSTTTLSSQQPPESGEKPTEDGGSTPSIPTETLWKRVPGYDEFEVTADGAIRENGGPARIRVAGSGHIYVLRTKSRPALLVHRAVLFAFAGPCPPGHVARHLNDNPADNRWSPDPTLNNLQWGTKKENAEDRVRNAPLKQGWTEERRLLERIKQLEAEAQVLKVSNLRLKAAVANFLVDRNYRVTDKFKKDFLL